MTNDITTLVEHLFTSRGWEIPKNKEDLYELAYFHKEDFVEILVDIMIAYDMISSTTCDEVSPQLELDLGEL